MHQVLELMTCQGEIFFPLHINCIAQLSLIYDKIIRRKSQFLNVWKILASVALTIYKEGNKKGKAQGLSWLQKEHWREYYVKPDLWPNVMKYPNHTDLRAKIWKSHCPPVWLFSRTHAQVHSYVATYLTGQHIAYCAWLEAIWTQQ